MDGEGEDRKDERGRYTHKTTNTDNADLPPRAVLATSLTLRLSGMGKTDYSY
jgi:hypothetical protein